MHLLLLAVCLLASVQTQAQKFAGYRGKHFMAGYTTNIGHNLFASDYFGVAYDKPRLHFRHGLHAEFLTNRYTTLGVEADYINTKVATTSRSLNNGELLSYDSRFVSMSVGGYMKQYLGILNGLIAPMGGYAKVKVFVEKMHISNKGNGLDEKINKYWSPGFGLGYGQSRIIKNTVRLDGAIEFNALLGVYSPAISVVSDYDYLKNHKMAFYHLMAYGSTVRFGVSGLLF